MLYHYILKYALRFNEAKDIAELFKTGKAQIFSDDEMQNLRLVLRENIECMWSRERKL